MSKYGNSLYESGRLLLVVLLRLYASGCLTAGKEEDVLDGIVCTGPVRRVEEVLRIGLDKRERKKWNCVAAWEGGIFGGEGMYSTIVALRALGWSGCGGQGKTQWGIGAS